MLVLQRFSMLTPQQKNAVDPSCHVWVQASAGSGKTKVLTDRILALLCLGADPEKILCVTFTRAAAAEMAQRLRTRTLAWSDMEADKLREELRALSLAANAKTLASAQGLFRRISVPQGGVKIQTLHAFCESLLKRFPLEAGISHVFQVWDEHQMNQAFQKAFQCVIEKILTGGDAAALQALHFLSSMLGEKQFQDVLWQICALRSCLSENFAPDFFPVLLQDMMTPAAGQSMGDFAPKGGTPGGSAHSDDASTVQEKCWQLAHDFLTQRPWGFYKALGQACVPKTENAPEKPVLCHQLAVYLQNLRQKMRDLSGAQNQGSEKSVAADKKEGRARSDTQERLGAVSFADIIQTLQALKEIWLTKTGALRKRPVSKPVQGRVQDQFKNHGDLLTRWHAETAQMWQDSKRSWAQKTQRAPTPFCDAAQENQGSRADAEDFLRTKKQDSGFDPMSASQKCFGPQGPQPAFEKNLHNDAALGDFLESEGLAIHTFCNDVASRLFSQMTLSFWNVSFQVLQAYDRLKQDEGALDYEDLLRKASALLKEDPGWVLYALDGGTDHMLIDEAQDTSASGWGLIQNLMDVFLQTQGQHKTLFVVGDPKQSIYSFQGARPALFSATRDAFKNQLSSLGKPLRLVQLTTSFRSAPLILNLVDHVFSDALAQKGLFFQDAGVCDSAQAQNRCQKPLVPLKHNPSSAQESWGGSVQVWPLFREEENDTQEAEAGKAFSAETRLALSIVKHVKGFLQESPWLSSKQRSAQPCDVMILVRKRGVLVDMIGRFLKEEGIPIEGQDRLKLTESLAVQDVMALAASALSGSSDLTLASFLKSPGLNFSEDALFYLAYARADSLWDALQWWHPDRKDRPAPLPYLTQKIGQDLPPEHWEKQRSYQNQYAHAAFFLADARRQILTLTPSQFFYWFLKEKAGEKTWVSAMGPRVLEPLQGLLQWSEKAEESCGYSMDRVLQRLHEENPLLKQEVAGDDGVRILTVHGVKGLEAPVVILADAASFRRPGAAVLWSESGAALLNKGVTLAGLSSLAHDSSDLPEASDKGLRTVLNPELPQKPPALTALIQEADAQAEEESNRLLYVALTRSTEHVVVAGIDQRTGAAGTWYDKIRRGLQSLGKEPGYSLEKMSSPFETFGKSASNSDDLQGASAGEDRAQEGLFLQVLDKKRSSAERSGDRTDSDQDSQEKKATQNPQVSSFEQSGHSAQNPAKKWFRNAEQSAPGKGKEDDRAVGKEGGEEAAQEDFWHAVLAGKITRTWPHAPTVHAPTESFFDAAPFEKKPAPSCVQAGNEGKAAAFQRNGQAQGAVQPVSRPKTCFQTADFLAQDAQKLAPDLPIDRLSDPLVHALAGVKAAFRGTLVHALLQRLPAYAQRQWPKTYKDVLHPESSVLETSAYAFLTSSEQRSQFFDACAGDAFLEASSVLLDPNLSFLLTDRAYREVPFLTQEGDQALSGRCDVVYAPPGGSFWALDYKTNAHPAAVMPGSYRHQLQLYRQALSLCLGADVRAGIIWTKTRQIQWLEEKNDSSASG